MFFLDIEFEFDAPGDCGSDSELDSVRGRRSLQRFKKIRLYHIHHPTAWKTSVIFPSHHTRGSKHLGSRPELARKDSQTFKFRQTISTRISGSSESLLIEQTSKWASLHNYCPSCEERCRMFPSAVASPCWALAGGGAERWSSFRLTWRVIEFQVAARLSFTCASTQYTRNTRDTRDLMRSPTST